MKIKKKIFLSIFSAILALALALGGFFVGRAVYSDKELRRVKFILDTYHKYYYEESDDYLSELVHGLMDNNSDFFTKSEYEKFYSTSSGKRNSIGVSVDGELNVVKVAYNSPAETQGVETGGKIVKVDGTKVESITDINNAVKGKTVATYTILYGTQEKEFTLSNKEFTETFVKYYDGENEYGFGGEKIELIKKATSTVNGKTLPSGYSYLKYVSFMGADINSSGWEKNLSSSVGQFMKALEVFQNSSNKKLIIDLRDNGGGYVEAMRYLIANFIGDENGKKLTVQKNNYKNRQEEIKSYETKSQNYDIEKIIVLANSSTASASEAFIGALLDYDKANKVSVVVEYNQSRNDFSTYGKGTMQDFIFNGEKEVVKLTVAKICFPISETCIDKKGISKNVSDKVINSVNAENQRIDALSYVCENF